MLEVCPGRPRAKASLHPGHARSLSQGHTKRQTAFYDQSKNPRFPYMHVFWLRDVAGPGPPERSGKVLALRQKCCKMLSWMSRGPYWSQSRHGLWLPRGPLESNFASRNLAQTSPAFHSRRTFWDYKQSEQAAQTHAGNNANWASVASKAKKVSALLCEWKRLRQMRGNLN